MSLRLGQRGSLKCEITATYLSQHWNDALHTFSRWGMIKHVTDIEISCEKSQLVSLRNPPKKGFHMLAFDYWFSYDAHDPRVWCDILNFEVDRKVYFNHIYDGMVTKNKCDLRWKKGMVLFQQVDLYTGVNIRILLIVNIVMNFCCMQ